MSLSSHLLGIGMTLMAGKTVPRPIVGEPIEALKSIEIEHNDSSRSGFQMVFDAKRTEGNLFEIFKIGNYSLLENSQLKVGNRIRILVYFGLKPQKLMDGIITHIQLNPGGPQEDGIITITGEDLSIQMDLEEKIRQHRDKSKLQIAQTIIAKYRQYQLTAKVSGLDRSQRVYVQRSSDLAYLQSMADDAGLVFYVDTVSNPSTNTVYIKQQTRTGVPQKTLNVNLGPYTNVNNIDFNYDALAPVTKINGNIQDAKSNKCLPIKSFISKRPPLSKGGLLAPSLQRTKLLKKVDGSLFPQARKVAQAELEASRNQVVTVEGELDTGRYGSILHARGLVGLRGVGKSYDGLYYVKSVTHQLSRGEYKQNFTLSRDGTETSVSVVRGEM